MALNVPQLTRSSRHRAPALSYPLGRDGCDAGRDLFAQVRTAGGTRWVCTGDVWLAGFPALAATAERGVSGSRQRFGFTMPHHCFKTLVFSLSPTSNPTLLLPMTTFSSQDDDAKTSVYPFRVSRTTCRTTREPNTSAGERIIVQIRFAEIL